MHHHQGTINIILEVLFLAITVHLLFAHIVNMRLASHFTVPLNMILKHHIQKPDEIIVGEVHERE